MCFHLLIVLFMQVKKKLKLRENFLQSAKNVFCSPQLSSKSIKESDASLVLLYFAFFAPGKGKVIVSSADKFLTCPLSYKVKIK